MFLHAALSILITASAVYASSIVVGIASLNGVALQPATDVTSFNTAVSEEILLIEGGRGPVLVTTVKLTSATAAVFYALSNSTAFGSAVATGWPSAGNPQLSSRLSTISTNIFGQSPTSVSYSDKCTFGSQQVSSWSTPAPVSQVVVQCTDKISLTFKSTASISSTSLKDALCSHLQLPSCSVVNITAVNSESKSVTLSLATTDPHDALELILGGLYRPSRLSFFSIESVEMENVVVFMTGSTATDSFDGTFEECMKRLWYLLFLILLIPLTYIVASVCYRRGKVRGKAVAREQDEDAKKKAEALIHHQQQQQHRGLWMSVGPHA